MMHVDAMNPETPYDLRPLMPHDRDVEQRVLGSALLVEGGGGRLLQSLEPEDFYVPEHQAIFRAIRDVADAGDGDADAASVKQCLQRRALENACGGLGYLDTITLLAADGASHMPRQMRLLRELRVWREGMESGKALHDRCQQGASSALETLTNHRRRVDELMELVLDCDDDLTETIEEIADIQGEIEWLWEDWIPRGQVTLLVAEPGVGKSALALYLTASAFGARPWPDGKEASGSAGPCVYCDTEGNQRQILDRVKKWGLPSEALRVWKQERMRFDLLSDECVLRAERMVDSLNCSLMVVDTLRGGFDGDENSSEVGRMLTVWQEMARRTNVALVIVHHERKSHAGERGGGLNCVRGSSALTASAKSIIRLSHADRVEGRVRVHVIKSNYAPATPELMMRQRDEGLSFASEEETVAQPLKIEQAQALLLEQLADGAKPVTELLALAARRDISRATLYRAASELGVPKERVTLPDGTAEWLWAPPAGVRVAEAVAEEDPPAQ